jgi:ABC-type Fe3+/spermidine/putrescine transport system ATPase subunit
MSESESSPFLQLIHLHKSFAGQPAVADISLTMPEGHILCLLGPSGCGKTTLLRLIAGLERPDAGRILFGHQDMSTVPPHRRNFGLMFQEFALFPHKNVGQNVAFGLEMQQAEAGEAKGREMLELVGLAGFEERDVNSLSGGERQRVALARSLAPKPRLLMLDEPLGALDRALRERLMLEIRQILKKIDLSAIYVTHDQTEAFAVADRVLVMNQGRIEQDSPPEILYRQPATPFVARFLGFSNLLDVTYLGNGRIETPFGVWPVAAENLTTGQQATALIRPEAASFKFCQTRPVVNDGQDKDEICFEAELTSVTFRGRFYQVTVSASGQSLTFEMPLAQHPQPGQNVTLCLNLAAISLFC